MDGKILPFPDCPTPDWSDALIDALHLAIADKLEVNPRLLGIAVHNLSIWRKMHPTRREIIRQWKLIVYTWEFADIVTFLRRRSPDARRLRREGPFCGILTPEEMVRSLQNAIFDHEMAVA